MRFYYLLLPCLMALTSLSGQQVPFQRGVNLTGWFQATNARRIQFSLYSKTDFAQIKSLGCDVIRLPINLHVMTDGAPHYRVDPLLFAFLDSVVTWAEELELHLILDNHTFDPSTSTEANIGAPLKAIWPQLAAHFKNRSNRLYYEILNEPHGIADALWNQIQGEVIQAIRAVDTAHTIIVGPANWNSYQSLAAMPTYSDPHLIYTFHFYDPFLFTHQGASWTDPSLVPLSGIPFPYGAASMPALPAALRSTWIESGFQSYAREGTAARVRSSSISPSSFATSATCRYSAANSGYTSPTATPFTDRPGTASSGNTWKAMAFPGPRGITTAGSGCFSRALPGCSIATSMCLCWKAWACKHLRSCRMFSPPILPGFSSTAISSKAACWKAATGAARWITTTKRTPRWKAITPYAGMGPDSTARSGLLSGRPGT
ncbi:MAG: glycoside hydrolase family 5 protein [Haliscomenobacter sp.]|nr:glycoside hydrolase family 5 protein [Haliscomenobacter sp.]